MSDTGDLQDMQPQVDRRAQGFHGMGLGWIKSGKPQAAITCFRRAIEADRHFLDPYLELGPLYLEQGDWDAVIDLCQGGLRCFNDISEFHKMLITAMESQQSSEAAWHWYDLRPVRDRPVEIGEEEIICCVTARNEMPRLPRFLQHYRQLGVDRFFFIDNDSDDDSLAYLLEQPDVELWQSSLPFMQANYGSSWFELLLRRYGVGHWCLTVDTDEFLVYSGSPGRDLRSLCRDMEARGQQALAGQLLDMYSQGPVRDVLYEAGDDPLHWCPFFDQQPWHRLYESAGQYRNLRMLFGGPRQRVFPTPSDYMLSKIALLYYLPERILASGQHMTNLPPEQIAHNQMVLLHFKFFASFDGYARDEAQRGVHAMGGEQYRSYTRELDRDSAVSLYHPAHSVRYESFKQLLTLGIVDPADA